MPPSPQHPDNSKVSRNRRRLIQWRPFLWRWHRRLGLAAAAVVILVSVTGIFLNHTSDLSLSSHPVSSPWLLRHYGIEFPEITIVGDEDHWVAGDQFGGVHISEQNSFNCEGAFVSALLNIDLPIAPGADKTVVACEGELVLLVDGQVVERILSWQGLPVPVSQLGSCDQSICIMAEARYWALDFAELTWEEIRPSSIEFASVLADKKIESLLNRSFQSGIDWERLLLDLHSGRLFGKVGVIVVDIAAVFMLLLSISGFLLWYQARHRRR